jgi:subtilisin-like proprotein convertase family protein
VTVTGGGQVAVTGADGTYQLGPLAQGSYPLTAVCAGYLDGAQVVAVAHGQHLMDVDFTLVPALSLHLEDAPQIALPDGLGGVVRPLAVTATGACAGVSVDISVEHPRIGDLVVNLISPGGTVVRLHDRSGGDADDLTGNWPATLVVDGPGALGDFLGQDIHGTWLLHVMDAAPGNAGVWRSWGLNLLVPAPVTPVPGDGPPLATRLVGNVPNPFNPQTEVAFDLAREAAVKLEVFDVRGRMVRRLVDGRLAAGRHAAVWDGRDDDGREVASGTYLARLAADDEMTRLKMTLVR